MKKARSVGLIVAGNLTDSPLKRFHWLSERLGPVKSASYRVASRIANMLQAGHPVKDYAKFESCSCILVCVPEEILAQLISEMASAGISWRGKAVILCSTWLDSGELHLLASRGASVGSICPIPGFDDAHFLVEGDALAIRQSKNLVEYRHRRAVAIERPLKPFFLAALTCTGTLLFALLHVASESLRLARVPRTLSGVILEGQLSRSLRAYLKGGLRASAGLHALPRQLQALSSANPELANYLEQTSRLAAQLLAKR
jgi:predicted short-subunit dehydrogenase-like oxidoreductase (DUF2520 family)